ncbi:hypothetical protein TM51_12975 [Thermobifida fusca TM51]|uniref:Glycosyltransferase RgtA/B/C/D-like domain-containing protein n=1 Tax=Thermobifida fusca TM51 TaxID=1169414 RepID=A0A9P2T866_THEFU|nr:hypothetical protein [Thermobifida fusca]EOR70377.1 hypothetical protein TM51_12975 [Thermobifida fusca TM51]
MHLSPGTLLARVTLVPVVAATAWLAVAFPLLCLGHFTPLLGVLLGGPALVAALVLLPRLAPDIDDTPWWALLLVVLVTAAFAAVQLAYHSEQLVVRRDAASYAQYTAWIAEYGFLPIPQQRELIAGNDPALTYHSLAYYQVDDVVWPQFLAGAPLVYALGFWAADLEGLVLAPPVTGALAVLTFAGLVARLVGARWAPLAALLLAVCLPQQWISRSTYSEPVAQIMLLGGLVLAYDALERRARGRWSAGHTLALAAGLSLGLGLLVRIDALRDLLPVVGFVGLLLVARRREATPLGLGLAVGAGYGFVAGFGYSRPYLNYLADSLNPLLFISGIVVGGTAAGVLLLWRRGIPRLDRPPWLPTAGAVLVVVAMAAIAARPLLFVQRGHGDEATGIYIGQVQEIEGLPVDPDRTYEEMSLTWVGWYVGWATVLLATLSVALLVRRMALRPTPQWVLPLMVLSWTVGTTLLRPAITPDHPWASRRLVTLVLPAFILFAVFFLAWARHRVRDRAPHRLRRLGTPLAVLGAATLLLPTAATAAGIMTYRMDVGSIAATRQTCAELPDTASVLIVDPNTAAKFMQLIRGMCGVPTAQVVETDPETVHRIVAEVHDRGRDAVLAADRAERLHPYLPPWIVPRHSFDVHTEQDPSTLMKPPAGAWRFNGDLWIAVIPATAATPSIS